MGDNSVVKVGRSLVMSMVGKSTRGAKVLKNSVGKAFHTRALDRLTDRLLEKSTALAVLDDRVSSTCRAILAHRSKCPSRNPCCKEEMTSNEEEEEEEKLKVENGSKEEALIPPSKGSMSSLENHNQNELHATKEEKEDEEEEEEVCKERGDYSSCSEEEFKEMVDSFIQRFNQQIAHEYNSSHHSHSQEIVFMGPPLHSPALC